MPLKVVALFLLMTVTMATAQAPSVAGSPMLLCSGLPCVDATLANGHHVKLLLDTGNEQSVMDLAAAKKLGLTPMPIRDRFGKPTPYQRAVLTGVKLGDASLGNVTVLVEDLSPYFTNDTMPYVDGSLAYTAFKDRLLKLDYPDHKVLFSEPLTSTFPCPGDCGQISLPTFGQKGPSIVVATGFSVNGQAITAQVDSLFAGTMLIYPHAVERLNLEEEAKTANKEFFRYTDGGVDMLKGAADTESFGTQVLANGAPLYFATPKVHLPDGMFDGTIGHALLEHSVVNFDFHNMRIWLN